MYVNVKKFKCGRCGEEYDDLEKSNYPGKPCKECTDARLEGRKIYVELMNVRPSITEEDKKILDKCVAKLNNFVDKTSREENQKTLDLLNALLKRYRK